MGRSGAIEVAVLRLNQALRKKERTGACFTERRECGEGTSWRHFERRANVLRSAAAGGTVENSVLRLNQRGNAVPAWGTQGNQGRKLSCRCDFKEQTTLIRIVLP